jgi:Tol biopolymer transport system component
MGIRWKLLFALATIVVVYLSATDRLAAKKSSDWSAPVLVPNVNSEFGDSGPAISRDGRSLYFQSNRPGGIGMGNFDIWVSQRARVKDPWGAPKNLGPTVNTDANEAVPALSRDGHWMFFTSNRPNNGFGALDLWVSYRRNTHSDFGWGAPMNLGPKINSSFGEAGPSYFANRERDGDEKEDGDEDGGALLFFDSNRPPGGPTNTELYVSPQFSDGSFGLPTVLSELNSSCNDTRPSIRSDGLEIFFHSNRPAPGGAACSITTDLWVATRDTLSQVWNTPENLGPVVNGPSNDVQPYISSDGRTLYFGSDRPGGPGLLDLYVTTRNKGKPGRDDEDDRAEKD